MRAYIPNADEVPITLKSGINRIFIKLTNGQAGWGFGVSVPKALF